MNNEQRLQLTTEEIERAQMTPVMPGVVTIGVDDLPPETPARAQHTAAPITITAADLTAIVPQPTATANIHVLEQHMFNRVNAARQTHLPRWLRTARLKWHDGLAAVARGHSADMLQRQYVDHVSPEGVTAVQRIEQYGIRYLACGENIGVVYGAASHSQQGVDDIHNAFMNQPRRLTNHRGNLLNPIWTHVGIGIAYHPTGSLIATQNFIFTPGNSP